VATTLAEQAMATLAAVALLAAMALMPLGKETTVATTGTVATVTGNRTAVTADEGDANQCEQHRKGKTEKTLHKETSTREKSERRGCVHETVTNGTPIRDGHRTAATDVLIARQRQGPTHERENTRNG
jgi:hypothetical protein